MLFFKSKTPTESLQQAGKAGRKLSEDVLQSAEQAVVGAGAQARAACAESERMAQYARQYVAERPLSAVMVATAAGALVVGALWAMRSQPSQP
jgi:ElaB/YqjD/DUF883 family membrane-anchored ribosome-binding protein